jgi:chromosome segregation ATPase
VAQSEERLARWEQVERKLERAFEQVAARDTTIAALQSDIKRMFETAEHTIEDVRAIAGAQQEVAQTRTLVDDVLSRLKEFDTAVVDLDARKRLIERAEERLARADALLIDIQSSIEGLHSQKAFVDQVMETMGSLTFQTKQAEALIANLRQERDMISNRARAAAADLRQQQVAAEAS